MVITFHELVFWRMCSKSPFPVFLAPLDNFLFQSGLLREIFITLLVIHAMETEKKHRLSATTYNLYAIGGAVFKVQGSFHPLVYAALVGAA